MKYFNVSKLRLMSESHFEMTKEPNVNYTLKFEESEKNKIKLGKNFLNL